MFPVKSYKNFKYLLAFLNSKLVFYMADCLNPTANIQVGDLKRVPFVLPDRDNEKIVSKLAEENIGLTRKLLKSKIFEPDFVECVFSPDKTWKESIRQYTENKLAVQAAILVNEAVINEHIFRIYSLSNEDKKLVAEKQGNDVVNIPITNMAKKHYLEKHESILTNIAREKIENITIRENIENVKDVISAILRNISLDEICVRFNINPIDIWGIFVQNNEISMVQAKELSFEFLTDIIREILVEDDDGVIPLVPNTGEKVLLERIEDKFREKGFSMAQYSQFDKFLGRTIDEYINKHLFSDLSNQLDLFSYLPKTPFIWHLSSGSEQGFDCYIIIYTWSRDKLMRLRSVYIEHRERSLVNRQTDLAGNNSAEAQNEKDKIRKQLQEIESFKQKIDELLAEGYDPILDDGVGKNIAPLQKKKMIPYDVLNAGQLKKYLSADW